jgi:Na+-transporting NADH:ubiquinone oxidoreductase subunit NqrA
MSLPVKITKGLDLRLRGEPEQSLYPGQDIQHVALIGRDYIGFRQGQTRYPGMG